MRLLPHDGARDSRFDAEVLVHLDAAYRFALQLTQDQRRAEDVTQEAMLHAYRGFHRFRAGSNGRSWLFKIVHNVFRDALRQQHAQRTELSLDGAGPAGSGSTLEPVDPGLGPEAAAIAAIEAQELRAAIGRLPPEFAATLLLVDVEELSYREAAAVLGCPLGTVMSRLHRARRMLRAELLTPMEAADGL